MNLTDLLAMPIIHLPTATLQGVVSGFGVSEDGKSITHVVAIDEDSYCREQYYDWNNVKVGTDALCCVGAPALAPTCRVPFRGAVYDTDGKACGWLQDVCCASTGRIRHYLTTQQPLRPRQIVAVGDVIVCRGRRRVASATPADGVPQQEESKPSQEAAPSETHKKTAPLDKTPIPMTQPEGSTLHKVAGDYSFLLGRTLRGDLVHQGRVLFAQGSLIDQNTIQQARECGLLLTLTVLSR